MADSNARKACYCSLQPLFIDKSFQVYDHFRIKFAPDGSNLGCGRTGGLTSSGLDGIINGGFAVLSKLSFVTMMWEENRPTAVGPKSIWQEIRYK